MLTSWPRSFLCLLLQTFVGNVNSEAVVQNKLSHSVRTRILRFVPLDWNPSGWLCLRVEVYGCSYSEWCTLQFKSHSEFIYIKPSPNHTHTKNEKLMCTGSGCKQMKTMFFGSFCNLLLSTSSRKVSVREMLFVSVTLWKEALSALDQPHRHHTTQEPCRTLQIHLQMNRFLSQSKSNLPSECTAINSPYTNVM